MARHLVAVCVVCLLCAEHFPCKGHIEGNENNKENLIKYSKDSRQEYLAREFGHESNFDSYGDAYEGNGKNLGEKIRLKRHTHHTSDNSDKNNNIINNNLENRVEISDSAKMYLKKIFSKYGTTNDVMTMANFNEILNKLELKTLLNNNNDKITYNEEQRIEKYTDSNIDQQCITSQDLVERIIGSKNDHHNHHHPHHHEGPIAESRIDSQSHNHHHNHDDDEHEHDEEHHKLIDINTMLEMCPILMYHVISNVTNERNGCIMSSDIPLHDHHDTFVQPTNVEDPQDKTAVWFYSTLAILGVSLCGLLGVAVIPCMEMHAYHHVLQFFVALAVGTLCGDALLHLLPHSMIHHPMEHEAAHEYMTYKGLAAVGGIVFFYFVERSLTIIAARWAQHQKKGKLPSRVRVIRDPEASPDENMPNIATSDKQCKHKYSSYPYCYNEIAMETKDDHHEHPVCINNSLNGKIMKKSADGKPITCPKHGDIVGDIEINHHHQNDSEQKLLANNHVNNYTISDNYKNMCNSFSTTHGGDSIENTVTTSVENSSVECSGNGGNNMVVGSNNDKKEEMAAASKKLLPEENYTIILKEHHRNHHGHSHTHGHVHSPPDSLSAVAWMVIMGDGLHNFTDGMAIGAAFSNNIAGGFSTAIAVFCHELPHELGDFAVLLKAGMTAKQAVFYNILSSILSFFGMVVGVIVGETPDASAWIFAVAAGMFIYIALVDMIPELTSSHNGKEERCQLSELILQFLGMTIGFGIMLLISIYEHDLKEMFSDDDHQHKI